MRILWMLCTMITFNFAQCDNVTTVSPGLKYNDVCTNECHATDPSHWCGKYRADGAGKVMKCTEFTVNDASCASECVARPGDGFHVCMTNINKISVADWWDYCSRWGYTTNGAKCLDTCSKGGEKYFWCHTASGWDYCSPQGQVRPMQYTYKGGLCIGECKNWGEKYYWCKKNINWCKSGSSKGGGSSCDDWWDYCSPDPWYTRYNKKCKEPCRLSEKGYYGCYEENGDWDYCSPAPEMGVDVKEHVEQSIYGERCGSTCSNRDSSYYWCSLFYGGKDTSVWDYCSPSPNLSIHNVECTSECASRKERYYWCTTAASWDYCSPTVSEGPITITGAETLYAWFWFLCLPTIVLCCCGVICSVISR